jgi:hypothetical protein
MPAKVTNEEFQPKIVDVRVDIMRHRTPITEINLDELKKALPLPEGGYDIGIRKEALVVDFTGGRIVISANGVILSQFYSLPFCQAKGLILGIIRYLCERFNWLLDDQLFATDTDLVVEALGNSPVENLSAAVDHNRLRNILGLRAEEKIHAIGLTIFLNPLKGKKDFRLRIEPLAAEPERKYYLRFSSLARELSFKDLEITLDEIANYAISIATRIEGKKS